jgi:ribonuclease D
MEMTTGTNQTGLFQRDRMSSMKIMNKTYKENITAEEIKELDLSWFKGEILLIDDLDKFNRVIPWLRRSKVLGFDTETKPSFKKGRKNKVSLIQLADKNKACLFRINKIGIPDELAAVLSDPGIIKCGVAIHDDIKILNGRRNFHPAGFIDLQSFVKDYGIVSSGLKKLSAIVLGFRISKHQQVTDWEAVQLSDAQQIYAATDAWVCYEIYYKLISKNN